MALLPLLAVNVLLSLTSDLAHHLVLTLALLGPAFAWLAWTARRLEGSHSSARGLSYAILAGAFLLRLPLLPLPLTLSDDALRYLWDGKVAAAGWNPYALAPSAKELTFLRDEVWQRLPHREVPTVYPPLSVAAFSIAARLPNPILAWKALVTAADLAACALLLALARRLGLPPARALWYAWNPLVAIEFAGMAHVDALGIAACVATVFCLAAPRCRSWAAAAGWSAAAVLAKLAPAVALPMWGRRSGAPGRMLAAAVTLVVLACLPVVAASGGVPPGLVTYAVSWEFDGPLFEPLWRLLDAGGAAPLLARLLDAIKRQTGEYTRLNPLYHYLYPQLLAKVLLALALAAVVAASLRRRRQSDEPRATAAATGWLLGAALLLSATVYPWYVAWVLPWAALCRHAAWRALSGLVMLSYLAQRGGEPLWPWLFLAIWAPFALLLILVPTGWGAPEP